MAAVAVAALALPIAPSTRLTLATWDVQLSGSMGAARKRYQAGLVVGDLFQELLCLGSPYLSGSYGNLGTPADTLCLPGRT